MPISLRIIQTLVDKKQLKGAWGMWKGLSGRVGHRGFRVGLPYFFKGKKFVLQTFPLSGEIAPPDFLTRRWSAIFEKF